MNISPIQFGLFFSKDMNEFIKKNAEREIYINSELQNLIEKKFKLSEELIKTKFVYKNKMLFKIVSSINKLSWGISPIFFCQLSIFTSEKFKILAIIYEEIIATISV